MTDKELLELAAKAAGIELLRKEWYESKNGFCVGTKFLRSGLDDKEFPAKYWNPLTDDGDALRLAVKLGVALDPGCEVNRFASAQPGGILEERRPDPYAATRRAIVRAAAEIGKELK